MDANERAKGLIGRWFDANHVYADADLLAVLVGAHIAAAEDDALERAAKLADDAAASYRQQARSVAESGSYQGAYDDIVEAQGLEAFAKRIRSLKTGGAR